MKKGIIFATALFISIALFGCKNGTAETETVQSTETTAKQTETKQPETEKQTETETQEMTETETQPETEAETEAPRVSTVIGSVEDMNMDTIKILSDNGNEIVFSIQGVELDFRNGFRIGSLVAIEYHGEIVKEDSSEIEVLRVVDSADGFVVEAEEETESESENEARVKETEKETEKETKKETEKESETGEEAESETMEETQTEVFSQKEVKGTLKSITMKDITIVQEDESELTLKIMGAQIYFRAGMAVGNKVVITYDGEIVGTETENTSVFSVQDDMTGA